MSWRRWGALRPKHLSSFATLQLSAPNCRVPCCGCVRQSTSCEILTGWTTSPTFLLAICICSRLPGAIACPYCVYCACFLVLVLSDATGLGLGQTVMSSTFDLAVAAALHSTNIPSHAFILSHRFLVVKSAVCTPLICSLLP